MWAVRDQYVRYRVIMRMLRKIASQTLSTDGVANEATPSEEHLGSAMK